jgi:hypothetical protein
VNLRGDRRPEIVAAVPDGAVHAVSPRGRRLWRHDYARGRPETFASEVVAADLNRDRRPELVFGTYGPAPGDGRLVVLSARGRRLHDVRLPAQRPNGNGVGIAAAPSIADIDRDGRLEIVVTTIDHGIDVRRLHPAQVGVGVEVAVAAAGRAERHVDVDAERPGAEIGQRGGRQGAVDRRPLALE